MSVDLRTPVGQLVRERLGRARVFERLGIDYCCHGGTPLEEACAERSLAVPTVVAEIEKSDARDAAADHTDYDAMPAAALADLIVATHHDYLKRELPRLDSLLGKVLAAHGERHRALFELRTVFDALRDELEAHLFKEERVLFPMIRQLEGATRRPNLHCGSVNNPIRVMEHEHDSAGTALARIRALTGGYVAPGDACTTYRALLQGLAELELDLFRHIHKENNILFPRAASLEADLEAVPVG